MRYTARGERSKAEIAIGETMIKTGAFGNYSWISGDLNVRPREYACVNDVIRLPKVSFRELRLLYLEKF